MALSGLAASTLVLFACYVIVTRVSPILADGPSGKLMEASRYVLDPDTSAGLLRRLGAYVAVWGPAVFLWAVFARWLVRRVGVKASPRRDETFFAAVPKLPARGELLRSISLTAFAGTVGLATGWAMLLLPITFTGHEYPGTPIGALLEWMHFFEVCLAIRREGVALLAATVAVSLPMMFGTCTVVALLERPRMRARAEGRCAQCGYALHGLTTRRCPECGRPF